MASWEMLKIPQEEQKAYGHLEIHTLSVALTFFIFHEKCSGMIYFGRQKGLTTFRKIFCQSRHLKASWD